MRRLSAPALLLILVMCTLARRTAAQQARGFSAIGPLVEEAIARHDLPGAVVLVGRGDEILYLHAYGNRSVLPDREPMTEDTIFDIASLTKVVATTTSIMQLMESGRLRLSDPVARFIPEFARYGKRQITIRHLLTHTSGLRPDLELEVEFDGADEAIRRAVEEVPTAPAGERFVYSDINFILLGDIVRRVTGDRLDKYAKAHIFDMLGMRDTMFLPPASLRPRIAPTERCRGAEWPCGAPDAPYLRGIVHDPTARRMGGVAGHAGLFSTAPDLARFCRALLNGGSLGEARILSPASVRRMTSPSTPSGMRDVRGLGWDIDSIYSGNGGDLFPAGSYGHTGFTGTSLWLDPPSKTYLIFLSNRVHPEGKGDVNALRSEVATVVAAEVLSPGDTVLGTMPRAARHALVPVEVAGPSSAREPSTARPTRAGVDVLDAEGFAPLKGKRVGLLTNQTGRARTGVSTIDLLAGPAASQGVKLVALFSPEHGIRGQANGNVASSRDPQTGLPVYSLYGDSRRPAAAMLAGLDCMVVDLQDIGARFYTYPASVAYVMEEAARQHLQVVVLDRPNPIDGFAIEGPIQDPEVTSTANFTAYFPMPIRHGLTLGELATLFNGENHIGANLSVIRMSGWRRQDWFDETGLSWVDPSPNMRNMVAAALYPGLGAIEGTNVSVGRGTDSPFQQVGAPWIDGERLAAALNARAIDGVRFYPVRFTPAATAPRYGGQECQGVWVIVTDRDRVHPVRVGLEIAAALNRLYPRQFKLDDALGLFGSKRTLERIKAGEDPAAIAASWHADEERWRLLRAKYLLY